jgi:uncharacterized protein YcfJ
VKRVRCGLVLLALALVAWTGSKFTHSDEFVYGGGALGIGTGAIIGAAAGNAAAGVAIGGPVGAVAGYFIGDSLKRALEGGAVRRPKTEAFVTAGNKSTEG